MFKQFLFPTLEKKIFILLKKYMCDCMVLHCSFLSQNFKIHMIQESYKVFHMTCAIFLSKTNLLSHRSFLQREDFDTKFSIIQFSDKFPNRQNRYTVTSTIIIVETRCLTMLIKVYSYPWNRWIKCCKKYSLNLMSYNRRMFI